MRDDGGRHHRNAHRSFAASIGIAQTDIKKVLAYSTVSQLGYMFMACGVGAFSAASST
jgi:NADH:ubiquinone oxidoreductase subunit 5 (subunit L)/multisubunit Na+/H+ antiporter MnhA subunit